MFPDPNEGDIRNSRRMLQKAIDSDRLLQNVLRSPISTQKDKRSTAARLIGKKGDD